MENKNWQELNEFIYKKMKEEHISGVSIGISENGQTIYQKGFGYRDVESQLPVTPETIFGIASVSKSFTALAIIELEKKGLLSVQDSVVKFLPELKINGVGNMESIKIHHLLSHSTGVPPMERKEDLNKYHEHIAYLEEVDIQLLGEPGEYFSYCNDTFLLLGAIIERITGQLYRRYMTNQYLEPLGMNRSTYSLEEVGKMDNVSVPYNFNNQSMTLEKVEWPKLGNYEAGGGIRSNVVDLLKYGQLYVKENSQHLQKMWQPAISLANESYYGYALNVTPNYANEWTLVQHGGGQPGVSSNFGFIPEKNLVVTVLTNVGGVGASDIWLAAANMALGLPIDNKISFEPYHELSVDELKTFEGVYSSSEGGEVFVFVENGIPYAEVEQQKYELRASGPETLVFVTNEKPLRFLFKETKEPWALFNGSRILRRVK